MLKAEKAFLSAMSALLILCASNIVHAEATAPPQISAEAAVLMDMDSGKVIYALNENKTMLIASTTKIMTALVVLEHLKPDDIIEIRPEWTGIEGSSMYLKAGERYSVEQLLYGLMLASGNDAAEALACYTAGSIEAFAELMNRKAAQLNMSGTHFTNPHGLNSEGHYSTALDMARLSAAAMKNEEFAKIVSAKNVSIGEKSFTNHNKLLVQYEGAAGVKTGYTTASGRTLAGCARRGNTSLICITLNDRDDWRDHAALFDWGFENFETVAAGGISCRIPVLSGMQTAAVAVCEKRTYFGEKASISCEIFAPEFAYAPVRKGDRAGEVRVYRDGEQLDTLELYYSEDVALSQSEELDFWEKLRWAWYYACKYGYRAYPIVY